MDKELLHDIYLSMLGQLIPEATIPWVDNLYAPGSICHRKYNEMRDAYERVCTRLGVDVEDEDEDLNCMVDALDKIQEVLCKEMFALGVKYAQGSFAAKPLPSPEGKVDSK